MNIRSSSSCNLSLKSSNFEFFNLKTQIKITVFPHGIVAFIWSKVDKNCFLLNIDLKFCYLEKDTVQFIQVRVNTTLVS